MKTITFFLFIMPILCQSSQQHYVWDEDEYSFPCMKEMCSIRATECPHLQPWNNHTFGGTVPYRLPGDASNVLLEVVGSVHVLNDCVNELRVLKIAMHTYDEQVTELPLCAIKSVRFMYNQAGEPRLCETHGMYKLIEAILELLPKKKPTIKKKNIEYTEFDLIIDIVRALQAMKEYHLKYEEPTQITHSNDSKVQELIDKVHVTANTKRVHQMFKSAFDVISEIQNKSFTARESAQLIYDRCDIGTVREKLSLFTQHGNKSSLIKDGNELTITMCLQHSLRVNTEYLVVLNKWYTFLNKLLIELSNSEIHKNIHFYVIQNFRTYLHTLVFVGKTVDETNMKTIFDCCFKSLYDDEYQNIKDIVIDKVKLKHLQNIVNYTVQLATTKLTRLRQLFQRKFT